MKSWDKSLIQSPQLRKPWPSTRLKRCATHPPTPLCASRNAWRGNLGDRKTADTTRQDIAQHIKRTVRV